MKFRNFIIVLLAVLMAFAFASCKHEPKVDPKPTPQPKGDVYQIEVTEGVDKDYYNRDKIKLVWPVSVAEGDVISLKYRSERAVYQWDIRNDSHKWVYETDKNGFEDPVLGEDGWYTMTYTIGKTITGAAGASSALGIYFRGNFVTTDIFEIKDIMLNDEELEVTQGNITSQAKLNEEPEDFDWSVKNYAVLFATGKPGEVDKTPIAEKVVAGGKVTGAPISKDGYRLTIYTDTAHTAIFDPDLPINEEKIFYYEYVGLPQTVTFVTGTEATIDPATIPYGDTLLAAHTYDEAGNYALYTEGEHVGEKIIVNLLPANPVKEGYAFAAWCSDAEATQDFDLATPITGATTLYAKFATPITVTFDAQNGDAPVDVIVAEGYPVAMPAAPENGTYLFTGWFTDAECTAAYDFSAPVTAAKTLYAGWVSAIDVTLNLNYTDAPEATVYKAPYGQALAEDDANLVPATRALYVFAGWYTDAGCTTAYNYETVLTANITLYAKWTEATLYQLVSTVDSVKSGAPTSNDKFSIYYKGDAENPEVTVNTGDVLSFRYRSTVAFTMFNVRGPAKWVYESGSSALTSYETKEDGWTYVTYEFPAGITDAYWRFDFISRNICVGDILEIQDWRLNGEPLTIGDSNVATKTQVGEVVSPTHSIVEGGSYAWTKQAVTFNMGVADALEPIEVAFGGRVEKPADPVKEGYVFVGWYADAEFTTAFEFANTPIFKATTIYAKLGEKKVVTFNAGEGATPVASADIASGEKVAEPAEPTKDGYAFTGWYLGETAYDFNTPVTENITLDAHWVVAKMVTFNLNYAGAPAATVVPVKPGEKVAKPKNPAKSGLYFAGWFTLAEGGEAVDFDAAVTEDKTVYAHWTEPTTYVKMTSTVENKRFTVRYEHTAISPEKGDVIAFKYRPHDGTFKYVNIRNENSSDSTAFAKDTNIKDAGYSSSEADANGWYTFYFEFPENYKSGSAASYPYAGFIMEMIDSGKWQIGDSLDILGFSYNGEPLAIALYDNGSYAAPTLATYKVSDDTLVE